MLYVFDEKEYDAFGKWLAYAPRANFTEKSQTKNMIIKGLVLGLADFVKTETCWELRFAADASQLVKSVDTKIREKTYKMLYDHDDKIGRLIQIYGVVEIESLYAILKQTYWTNLSQEDFFRFIYWHSRYNDFINTFYQNDGTCYVAMKEVDAHYIALSTWFGLL